MYVIVALFDTVVPVGEVAAPVLHFEGFLVGVALGVHVEYGGVSWTGHKVCVVENVCSARFPLGFVELVEVPI